MRQIVPEHLRGFLPQGSKGISLADRVICLEEALRDVLARLSSLEQGNLPLVSTKGRKGRSDG